MYLRNCTAIDALCETYDSLCLRLIITRNNPTTFDDVSDFFENPVHAGLCIRAACLAPYNTEEEEWEILDGS
jgi:hypothetical protein